MKRWSDHKDLFQECILENAEMHSFDYLISNILLEPTQFEFGEVASR